MMKTIYKYELTGHYTTELDLPHNAVVVDVAVQNDVICLWIPVDTEASTVKRYFTVVGTGWELDDNMRYIGTVHVPPFVWHVMEVM